MKSSANQYLQFRTLRELQYAKSLLKKDVRLHESLLMSGTHRFTNNLGSMLKRTIREMSQNLVSYAIVKLIQNYRS